MSWLAIRRKGAKTPRLLRWVSWKVNYDAEVKVVGENPNDWGIEAKGEAQITGSGKGKGNFSPVFGGAVANESKNTSEGKW